MKTKYTKMLALFINLKKLEKRKNYGAFIIHLCIHSQITETYHGKVHIKQISKKNVLRQKQAIRTTDSDTVRRAIEKTEKLKVLIIYKISLY